ncbi:MAG: tRNA glutamyl-Q(34) synthetase GluQRS [Rhodocyclaceae bacterium]|nr:tRNA glutamyl-Q(34) synthetase GluQRS [Rhodocyclaceae bacterium]
MKVPVGRFAPSPTGPLHFGSLVAALGSYLEAKARGGQWLVRIEDVDAPRCRQEYADDILATLEAFGFEWEGEVIYQSRRSARYREVFEALKRQGAVYPCSCTRAKLNEAPAGADGAPVYPGTCRAGLPPGKAPRAWRLRVAGEIDFIDLVQGPWRQDLEREVGDFVLLRADGFFAYQLAVVIDDADQGVDHVVRGADLIHSTARQIFLQRQLGLPTPAYAHLPVAVDATGAKLSKQTRAAPIDARDPAAALVAAARFLGQNPPEACRRASADFWAWALENWRLSRVPKVLSQPVEEHS